MKTVIEWDAIPPRLQRKIALLSQEIEEAEQLGYGDDVPALQAELDNLTAPYEYEESVKRTKEAYSGESNSYEDHFEAESELAGLVSADDYQPKNVLKDIDVEQQSELQNVTEGKLDKIKAQYDVVYMSPNKKIGVLSLPNGDIAVDLSKLNYNSTAGLAAYKRFHAAFPTAKFVKEQEIKGGLFNSKTLRIGKHYELPFDQLDAVLSWINKLPISIRGKTAIDPVLESKKMKENLMDLVLDVADAIAASLINDFGWEEERAYEAAQKLNPRQIASELQSYGGDVAEVAGAMAYDIYAEDEDNHPVFEGKKVKIPTGSFLIEGSDIPVTIRKRTLQETKRLIYSNIASNAEQILVKYNLDDPLAASPEAIEEFRQLCLADGAVSDSQIRDYGGWEKTFRAACMYI